MALTVSIPKESQAPDPRICTNLPAAIAASSVASHMPDTLEDERSNE